MPSYVPRRFNEDLDDIFDDAQRASERFYKLLSEVGHDAVPDVMRARVRSVTTKSPKPQYL
jgi:hypothetical protein